MGKITVNKRQLSELIGKGYRTLCSWSDKKIEEYLKQKGWHIKNIIKRSNLILYTLCYQEIEEEVIEGELWANIENTGYEVSNKGRIKSHRYTKSHDTKILDGTTMKNGYITIDINGEKVYVHRLVAYYFCNGYKEDLIVNHIDGNKTNNNATNLEWVSYAENNRHAIKSGLHTNFGYKHTEEQKEKKRATSPKNKRVLIISTGEIVRSCRELARRLNVDSRTLSYCIRKNKPYKGEYYKYI